MLRKRVESNTSAHLCILLN
uniref:Uncharacterized protein n=1 Tax=Rhizophora mucronata TaxID=61149 RepID=A0A2P2ITG2_RHIMU